MWAVGPLGADPVEGTLSLTPAGLSFSAPKREDLVVAAGLIRGVRRLRASPALKLAYVEGDGIRTAFFFFAEPPPLPGSRGSMSMRGAQRATAGMTLRAQSKTFKGDIQAWVDAIRALKTG